MSFVTGIVVVPLPFTTSIVAPVKSAFSPYFVAFVGCVFTFMFVTVSVTVYVYGTFTVVPFSVYSMSELLGVPEVSVVVLKLGIILVVTVISSSAPVCLCIVIVMLLSNASFTLYVVFGVPFIVIVCTLFIISIG